MATAEVTRFQARITLTNEDEGHTFAAWAEPLDDTTTVYDPESDSVDFGELFRLMQREYGVCRSSVFVDRLDGPPAKVGWFFVSRQRYEDTGERYLRGAWVTVEKVCGMPWLRTSVEVSQ